MKIKDNSRLIELRLAILLNAIANMDNRPKVNNILYVLKACVASCDTKFEEPFNNVLANSINEVILGADKKELCLALQVYYDTKNKQYSLLGTSRNTYMALYPNMKDYVTQEYIDGLKPRYAMLSNYYDMCKIAGDFADTFRFKDAKIKNDKHSLGRHAELKFRYVYDKLNNYFGSESYTNNFIVYVCRHLKINVDIINEVISSKHLVYRGLEENLTTNMGIVKELVTFGRLEGWSLGDIATELLGKNYTYLSSKSHLNRDETENDHFIYTWYKPTVLKDEYAVYEVQRFLKVMGDFNDLW